MEKKENEEMSKWEWHISCGERMSFVFHDETMKFECSGCDAYGMMAWRRCKTCGGKMQSRHRDGEHDVFYWWCEDCQIRSEANTNEKQKMLPSEPWTALNDTRWRRTEQMNEERVIVIGKVKESSGSHILLRYEAQTSARNTWIPRSVIMRQVALSDGRTAFVLEPNETEDGEFEQTKQRFMGSSAPLANDSVDIEVTSALENDEPLPEHIFDDDKPIYFATDGETPSIEIEDSEIFETERWDFVPTIVTAYVAVPEKTNAFARMQRVNDGRGDPAIRLVFNPNYIDHRRPAGAFLGSVEGDVADIIISYGEAVKNHKKRHPEIWENEKCRFSITNHGASLRLIFESRTFRYVLLEPERGWLIGSR